MITDHTTLSKSAGALKEEEIEVDPGRNTKMAEQSKASSKAGTRVNIWNIVGKQTVSLCLFLICNSLKHPCVRERSCLYVKLISK